ncbi:DUF771 domain-containing protein [Vagococcus carniphilus]|uniref:DUF771 domain-containing protein n=1 Tax=Vagococcus carniphilus TaxID=218144 RepID=UPI002891DA2B|nr:DUF771 domain-containing protein [Vagococcus carniphilus]MDT2848794.1 DUF771 domain-containing protein [Vagococcus carniphilus]
MQQLSVELQIPIPADSVLIKKTEYDELQKDSLKGKKFSIKELAERTGLSRTEIESGFENPKVRSIADVKRRKRNSNDDKGGFVLYPEGQGNPWKFLASATIDFIDNNFDLFISK